MGDFEKLIEAAKSGSVAEVRAITQEHAELVNRRDKFGATALHHAAFGGHREVVRVLVEHGAEINGQTVNLVRRLRGGRLNICGKWVDSWGLNWTILVLQSNEETSNGLFDS
jgi:ankyrin repeat protein